MKALRLLYISRAWAKDAGGMERLSFELIKELQKQPNVKLTTITRSGTSRLGAILFVLTSLPRALAAARRADVIHLGDPVLALHGWLIQKLFKKPVVVTIHGLDVTYTNPLYQFYLRMCGKFDLCLPISQHADALLKKSVVRCKASVVITPGVHDRYFDPSLTRSHLVELVLRATSYQLLATHRILFTAGRLVKRKGHAWFIEHVLPHLPNTVYVIAGDGPHFASLREAGRGKPEKVILLGRVSDEDLKILYNTVDAFVQPSISVSGDAEGFGLVLLEASLCQRPVFAANLEGITDAIHDGENGHLLQAQNPAAWLQALTTTLLVPTPVARAYTIKNFSWSSQIQKYLAEFQKIVQ